MKEIIALAFLLLACCPYVHGQKVVRGYVVVRDTVTTTKMSKDSLFSEKVSFTKKNPHPKEVIERYEFTGYDTPIFLKTEKKGVYVLMENGGWYLVNTSKLIAPPSMFVTEDEYGKKSAVLIFMFESGDLIELDLKKINKNSVKK
jgi:hypothetical protein